MPKCVSKEAIRAQQTVDYMRIISGSMGYKQLSQADLAKKMKVDRSTISRWLGNIDKMTFRDIRDLTEVLGIRIIFEGKWQQ